MIYLYSFIPLLFLPVDSSSIRDRNFDNELMPSLGSRLDPSEKDAGNSLKIVSKEPFIIQLQVPHGEAAVSSKDKDTKRKRPTKKRVSKIKPLRRRHRQRRDLQISKAEVDKRNKSSPLKAPQTATEHQSQNITKNSVSRIDILKALSSRKREGSKRKKHTENGSQVAAESADDSATGSNAHRISSSSPLVQMVYPSAPKIDKHLHKYTYKDLMSDRERLEKKIKYVRNMLNVSAADDGVRVRRRSEPDRTANKIAKMFLTLSAVNGLHERLKPKCDDDDDDEDEDDGYRVQDVWEKERVDSSSRKSSSSNEERYKVKKWIEHMKKKRSSSKSCPCIAKGHDEDVDVFPLEQKLAKNYYHIEKGGSSEESAEANGDKPCKSSHARSRIFRPRDDHEKKLKALAGKGRKFELPLDDLETYRMKAKQILQNAEEILDKIKEEEEKRVSMPSILANQLKELTSRIQTDPRNQENDLIRKIQKSLGWGPTSKAQQDGAEGRTLLEDVSSFVMDPYEKAKALTDESTKKLSSYLLRNLGELEESDKVKEEEEEEVGQAVEKEERKPFSGSLGDELLKSKEDLKKPGETVSSVLGHDDDDEDKKPKDSRGHQEEQFNKRMEDMMKEQEKKISELEAKQEPEEGSKELVSGVGSGKEEQTEQQTAKTAEKTSKGDAVAAPLGEKNHEAIDDPETVESGKTGKMAEKSAAGRDNASDESDYVSGREIPEGEDEKEGKTRKYLEEEETGKEFEKEKKVEALPDFTQSEKSKGEKESTDANENDAPMESDDEKSTDGEEVRVAATPPEGQETDSGDANGDDGKNSDRADEETVAQMAEQSKEEGKSGEETILERQQKPETAADIGRDHSPGSKETVGVSDAELNELQEETGDHLETTHREVEPQKVMEYADLLQETSEEKSLGKMKSNEGKDEDETLRVETPADEYRKDGESDAGTEDVDEETPRDDRVSKTREGLGAATLDGENSSEGFDDESGREILGEENLSKEISNKQSEDETAVKSEALDADDSGTFLKEANEEGTRHSGEEGTTPSEATTKGRSDEKDANVVAQTFPEEADEEGNEKPEDAEGSDETLLKSAVNKSREEGESRYEEETASRAGESDGGGSEEGGKTQNSDEGDDKILKSEKSTLNIDGGDSENDGGGVVSEEENEYSSDEGQERIRLKATGPAGELDEGNLDDDDINDGKLGTEREEKGTLSKEPGSRDQKAEDPSENSSGINDQSRKKPNWDATTGETLKAVLEEKDKENFDEDDEEETPLQATKSDKAVQESLGNEADGKSEEAEAVSDEQNIENRNVDKETSTGRENNEEEVKANLSVNEGDDEEATGQVDDDEVKKRGDDDDDADNLMRSLHNDDQAVPEDADEMPLTSANTDLGVDDEGKENQDNTPLGSTIHRDDGESLEDADATPLMAANNKDEETLEDADETPLKAAKNKDEVTLQDAGETPLRAANNKDEETLEDGDETPLRAANNKDEETLEDGDETPLRAANNKDEETLEDADETPLKAANNKDEETLQDAGETALRAANNKDEEALEDADETPLRAANHKDEETLEDAEETPLRAANHKDEETLENADETPLKAANNKDEETLEDAEEIPLRAANNKDEETFEDDDETPLRAANNKHEEALEDEGETPLKAANTGEDVNNERENQDTSEGISDDTPLGSIVNKDDGETLENADETPLRAAKNKHEESFEDGDETPLKAAMNKDEETLEDADEIPLRAVNIDDKDSTNSNEETPAAVDAVENQQIRAEDGETLMSENQENEHLDDGHPLRAASVEDLNNSINSEETPLRSTSDSESIKDVSEDDSGESLRAVNMADNVGNQIDGKSEGGTPLKSGTQKESEEDYETLREGGHSEDAEEAEENSLVTVAGLVNERDPEEEIRSESLKLEPVRRPLKAGKLKVPTSIAKIMKDLEGQEKDDITAIENLNPEKIDHIIDKIDEVEQQNRVTDELDCRKECACVEDINTRSRNRGRYEIVKDFLQWMKDLQLNRVLSDD